MNLPGVVLLCSDGMPKCGDKGYDDDNDDDSTATVDNDKDKNNELSPACTLKWPGHSRVQITYITSSAYHVQHVGCHVVRRDWYLFSFFFLTVEIVFILALLY